ncbi:hypothetical protein MOBT1_001069 [Malassezia obtusa]|uniref:Uncharacterized protein n=1 Tax=Malassezia obtusa TaxID=76774 RepID=A0AAF0IRF3_9BASI|nr:hypothetical protein MOBT1_001069 [Malassezia obtusa]
MSQTYQNAFILQSFGLDQPEESEQVWSEAEEQEQAGPSAPYPSPRREYKQGCPPQVKYDDEGNETFEWAWYQSVERLRNTWDGIMKRYSEAHFEDQDEIYLGRLRVPGDEPRLIRDRGSLRALKNRSSLDQFMHEELPQYYEGDEGDADGARPPPASFRAAPAPPFRRSIPMRAFDDDDEDLQEFMRQEARRREILGDEEDDVVDLREWDGVTPVEDAARPAPPRAAELAAPRAASPTVPRAPDDASVRGPSLPPPRPSSPDPNIAVELDIYRSVKREAVEQLLRSDTLGRAPVPYEIPGLLQMLS